MPGITQQGDDLSNMNSSSVSAPVTNVKEQPFVYDALLPLTLAHCYHCICFCLAFTRFQLLRGFPGDYIQHSLLLLQTIYKLQMCFPYHLIFLPTVKILKVGS